MQPAQPAPRLRHRGESAVRMTATGELVKSEQTCRVTDSAKVESVAA